MHVLSCTAHLYIYDIYVCSLLFMFADREADGCIFSVAIILVLKNTDPSKGPFLPTTIWSPAWACFVPSA